MKTKGLKSDKWYEQKADRLFGQINPKIPTRIGIPPPEDEKIQLLRELLKKKLQREPTMEEIIDTHTRMDNAIAAIFSLATKKAYEKKREEAIKAWKEEDKAKK